MKTYTKQDFHNPEQLTRQQVGREHRLLLEEEKYNPGFTLNAPTDYFSTTKDEFIDTVWLQKGWFGAKMNKLVYRVPLATPLPDGTVLSSNECCFSNAPSTSDDMAGLDDILGKQGYLNVNYNGITEVEQSASRIAKLLDERADCLAEVMLYRGENGDWTVEAGNPNACVMLGEVPGIIRAEGPCLLEALSNAENALTEREEKPRKKRVYVAGPMSNMPDYNFPAFYAAAESLEKQGYEPVNPAQLDIEAGYTLGKLKQLDPAEFQEFLRGAAKRDLDALQQCDAIALLPGWENSKGARAEKAVAEWLGLKTYTISPDNYGKWWLVIAEDVERINSKQENCEYCQGSCQGSTPSGCVGAEGVGVFGNLGPCSACIGYDGAEGKLGSVDTDYSDHIKQPDADGWIPHTPGDPMPCDGGTLIEIKRRDDTVISAPCEAWRRTWDRFPYANFSEIIAWRPAPSLKPYNSDERAEWDVDAPTATSTPQYALDDPKGAAGAKKAPMWLLPAHALQQTAWVHKLGSEKYGPYNWRKTSVCATTYISAIMRHLDAWRDGEDNDPESGIPHIAHVAASCNILLDAQHCDRLNDDRAKLCQI